MAASVSIISGETVEGNIRYIAPSADPQTRTFMTEIEIDGRSFHPLIGRDDLNQYIGPPLLDSFIKICGGDLAQAERARDIYRERYLQGGGALEADVFPGILEVIAASKAEALREVRADVAKLAVRVAENLLAKTVDAKLARELTDAALVKGFDA